jgi:hypothetical protein
MNGFWDVPYAGICKQTSEYPDAMGMMTTIFPITTAVTVLAFTGAIDALDWEAIDKLTPTTAMLTGTADLPINKMPSNSHSGMASSFLL